jgi:hypothetical protein
MYIRCVTIHFFKVLGGLPLTIHDSPPIFNGSTQWLLMNNFFAKITFVFLNNAKKHLDSNLWSKNEESFS